MTTTYKDKEGNVIRVDKGTQPKPRAAAVPPAAPPADAKARADSAAKNPAKQEK
ncbi:MAG: hypothetical protein ACTHNM_17285 [Dyella sp.]|uniref:hypothetical protein n=1 Tax=Dyella sp. TaxID=1869338 RepID=UPI003F819FEC